PLKYITPRLYCASRAGSFLADFEDSRRICSMSIRILIADDHIMFTDMLQYTLANQPEQYTVVGVASDGETALELTLSQRPDLLLLDYEMPKLGRPPSFCQHLLRQRPETRILVIGSHTEEEYAVEAAVGGAHGHISKAAPGADL